MNYEREIIRVLTEAGDKGLKVHLISRHVFNACNSMFAPVSYEEVHTFVGQYLHRNASRKSCPFIERTGWGIYRLKRSSKGEYLLNFQDKEPEEKNEAPKEDLSLSLF